MATAWLSKTLMGRMKKRAPLSLSMMACLLPFPLVASGEKSVSGTPAHVALVYLALAAMFVAFGLQVYYSGTVVEEALAPQTRANSPAWKKLLQHLPGNLILSMAIEAASLVPFFFTGYLKNERHAGSVVLVVAQTAMALPLFCLSLELWFRYFRWHGRRCMDQPLTRNLFLKHHRKHLGLVLLLLLPIAALPEWGWGLAVASVISTAGTVLILECLGIELRRLADGP